MRARIAVLCVAVLIVGLGYEAMARAGEPIFVQWLVVDDPGDQTINDYWERAQRDELSAPALVDLGTMLFYRGFHKDALQMYHRALDLDKGLYEAWFRIGLVEHSLGNLTNAEQAYERCLKKRPAHGWCNFYLGLLEEQFGHSVQAMQHYEQAFKSDPALANPKVNPEVLSSQSGSWCAAQESGSDELRDTRCRCGICSPTRSGGCTSSTSRRRFRRRRVRRRSKRRSSRRPRHRSPCRLLCRSLRHRGRRHPIGEWCRSGRRSVQPRRRPGVLRACHGSPIPQVRRI